MKSTLKDLIQCAFFEAFSIGYQQAIRDQHPTEDLEKGRSPSTVMEHWLRSNAKSMRLKEEPYLHTES